MITPMMKYSLVLYHKEYERFLDQLQQLGLVDITLANWEPTDNERTLMARIEKLRGAITTLKRLADEGAVATTDFVDARHAIESFDQASHKIDSHITELAKVNKDIEELKPWGSCNYQTLEHLREAGVGIHFYSLFTKEFETNKAKWSENHLVQEISRDSMSSYFVVAANNDEPLTIDAQELHLPKEDYSQKLAEREIIQQQLEEERGVIASAVPFTDRFEAEVKDLENELHLAKAFQSGTREAEGTIILLEGWATEDTQKQVDEMLDRTGTFYIKDRATEEDEAPVLLKNNKFSALFETIGNFYALPKYGTTDLTPYWGPFYAIFFGFCLGDAGYGALYVIAGLFLALKGKPSMKSIGWLVTCCGTGAVIFGLLTGNVFGIELAGMKAFAGMKDLFINTDKLFTLAIGIGFVHLLYAMSVRIYGIARQRGVKYSLAPLGWMIVIISSLAAMLLPGLGVEAFSFSSIAYKAVLGAGLFMMLFLNAPGKNPLVNLGAGLWNTYNDITGLLSDVLSYIRLFALCLSGGVLALVFNDLAMGMSGDIPVLKQLIMLIILLIGHGLNLFMSSLSAFVHPMRLTFVEFYKNAGFEASQRAFNPLRKEDSAVTTEK